MYEFHSVIFALPPAVLAGSPVRWAGTTCETLAVEVGSQSALSVGFDEVLATLSGWERMFAEPDGSFVWTSSQPVWQVDGNLYEPAAGKLYVEWKGRLPTESFDQFLAALGWPAQPVMFVWVPGGFFVNEAEFRRLASHG